MRTDRMEEAMRLGPNVTALYPYADLVAEEVAKADLVIGAVLVTGAAAPKVMTRKMMEAMEDGSVLVDIAIDQGGCFEDSHPTTHDDPTFEVHDSIFYCVANMPGAVPATSTAALTNATLPYVLRVAGSGWKKACSDSRELERSLSTSHGKLRNADVIAEFPDLPAA